VKSFKKLGSMQSDEGERSGTAPPKGRVTGKMRRKMEKMSNYPTVLKRKSTFTGNPQHSSGESSGDRRRGFEN